MNKNAIWRRKGLESQKIFLLWPLKRNFFKFKFLTIWPCRVKSSANFRPLKSILHKELPKKCLKVAYWAVDYKGRRMSCHLPERKIFTWPHGNLTEMIIMLV